ncbi:hypothetical protein V8D89_007810 [Ganoderma adspersum]
MVRRWPIHFSPSRTPSSLHFFLLSLFLTKSTNNVRSLVTTPTNGRPPKHTTLADSSPVAIYHNWSDPSCPRDEVAAYVSSHTRALGRVG